MDKEKVLQRWSEKVDFGESENDCWFWRGSKDKNGYGKICIENQLYYATQIGWWLYGHGEINERHLFHTCQESSCVNPSHLGTRETIWTKENLAPEEKKERWELAIAKVHNYRQRHRHS